MFNKTTHNHESKVLKVDKETIIEKTISPDKVVDMYDDVLETVEKTISRRISIKENNINVSVVEFEPSVDSEGYTYMIRFILNGKEYVFKKVTSGFEGKALSRFELIELIIKYYSQELIKILEKSFLEAAKWRIDVNKKEIQ